MSCDCTTYACLTPVQSFSSCPEFLTVTLEATETATYTWLYEFGGLWKGGTIDVENGERIIFPWVFNENYIHKIKIYKADGSLLNDTCYKLDTSQIAGSYTTPVTPEANYLVVTLTADMLSTDGDGQQVVTIGAIDSNTIIGIGDGNQFYTGSSFIQDGTSFTMTNGASFYAGQVITLLYA